MFLIVDTHPFWNVDSSVETRKMNVGGIGRLLRTAAGRLEG